MRIRRGRRPSLADKGVPVGKCASVVGQFRGAGGDDPQITSIGNAGAVCGVLDQHIGVSQGGLAGGAGPVEFDVGRDIRYDRGGRRSDGNAVGQRPAARRRRPAVHQVGHIDAAEAGSQVVAGCGEVGSAGGAIAGFARDSIATQGNVVEDAGGCGQAGSARTVALRILLLPCEPVQHVIGLALAGLCFLVDQGHDAGEGRSGSRGASDEDNLAVPAGRLQADQIAVVDGCGQRHVGYIAMAIVGDTGYPRLP